MRQLTLLLLVLCTCAVVISHRVRGRGRRWGTWWRRSWRWTCNHPRGNFKEKKVRPVDAIRVSRIQPVVGGTTADIGACPAGTCHYDHRRSRRCKPDGYICTETEEQVIDLGPLGNHTVNIVTGCKCCKDVGIEIRGQVVDAANNAPVAGAKLRIKSADADDVSGADGSFSLTVDSNNIRVVVKAKQYGFINAMTVVGIAEGFRGPVEVTIAMVRIAEPFSINATEDNELNIAADTSDPDAARGSISIPARSFKTKRGKKYKGVVQVSVNFIDTSNPDVEQEIPGVFVTNNGEPLLTDGIFALSYRAETGEPLSMGRVKVMVSAGMRLWKLNSDGEWVKMKARSSRSKRQAELTDQFLVDIENADWVNIDRIYGAPMCYFKTRIFDVTDAEIATSTTASFKPSIVAYRHVIINNQNRNQRMQFNPGFTTSPATTCHTVQCPNIIETADALLGLIQVESYEVVPIGSVYVPVIQTLRPKYFVGYLPSIQTSLSAVFYNVTPDDEVYANFIDDASGPLFTVKDVCESSDISQPAFHFLKPELPSIIPYPGDTELCTARIYFYDEYYFYSTLDELGEPLPAIHAVSTWSVDGDNYYYTDTTVMQPSDVGDFFFACITYRCSNADANTTVLLDFEIPVVNVTVNVETNATMEIEAFGCFGNCTTGNCYQEENDDVKGVIIDGSFVAPLNIPADGPDFFSDFPNSCADRGVNEAFAAEYYCYSNREEAEGEWNSGEGEWNSGEREWNSGESSGESERERSGTPGTTTLPPSK